ncbi:response regulator transcription factor [Ferruginibacter albus]|uniref:response regulator transcription factor n=1 Tax=Ferruginibacter albus TaxID=2875540 RepID=UPI001CC56ED0|nr:response regulator [Ferruginibacter albus]UAY52842.1 response regulator [Ferruginibacter albus]
MPKILIVEDSDDLLDMYKIVFSKFKFEMTPISTKETLVRQLVLNRPDIILLDIHLNGEDGREICKGIKQNKEFSSIPIIITSGSTEKLAACAEYFADDALQKPFDVTVLIEKINTLLLTNKDAASTTIK